MQNKPLVSILIASFNKERLVKRCIDSCLNQTYKNLEITFVDNDSSDNSYEIAKNYKKIKVYKRKRNKYSNYEFNSFNQIDTYIFACQKSKGKILCFLDSDDFYKKNKIQESVDFFLKNKNNILFDKPIIYFNKNNNYKSKEYDYNYKRKYLWPKFPPQSCISIRKVFFKKMLNELAKKKFGMLTLDFRLAILSKNIYNDFFISNKYLTYYYQDYYGETYSNFKKFNFNWWKRRLEAHHYLKYISLRYKKELVQGFDFYFTRLVVLFLNLLCQKFNKNNKF